MFSKALKALFLISVVLSSIQAFSQCYHCSAPSAPGSYGGPFYVTMYKNATVQLWAATPSVAVDGRQWYRVKSAGDTTYVGSGDTMAFTMDTTSRFICRNVNNCTCGGTYYSGYTLMSTVTIVDSPSVPQYWLTYDSVICSGTQTNIFGYTNSSVYPLYLQYLRDDTANVSGSITGSTVMGPLGITLTNNTGTTQTVRFVVRALKYGNIYFDSKSIYIKVLPGTASGGDHCSFPSKPLQWPNGTTDVGPYARGAHMQFLVDTTVVASGVDWYKVVGTDTTYVGAGYSISAVADTPTKYLARSWNTCSCNGGKYYSAYTLVANFSIGSSFAAHIIPLKYLDTIASGTGIDIIPRSDTSAMINMNFYRDNANVTGTSAAYTTANYSAVSQVFDYVLTNTTNVPQRIRYTIRSTPWGGYAGDSYVGYLIVMPSTFTAAAGNHCFVPTRTFVGSNNNLSYSKGATVYLDLHEGPYNVPGTPIITLPVADKIKWYKSKGPGDTTFLGDVSPIHTVIDTTYKTFAVSENHCYWPDGSEHTYESVMQSMTLFILGTTSVPAVSTRANNKPSLCSGDSANILLTKPASNATNWYRTNLTNVNGTSGASGSGTTLTIHPTLLDTVNSPQKVYFVSYANTGSTYGSQSLDSVTVYPDCSKWVNFTTAIHALKDSICPGDTATLTADTVPGLGNLYTWSTGDTTKTIHPTTAGTYTVTVTNSCGCSATSSFDIALKSAPIIHIAADTLCIGDTALITATGGVSYLWNDGQTTNSIRVTVGKSFSVTVTNSSGCSDRYTDSIIAYPKPLISVVNPNICSGHVAVIQASGAPAFVWSTGDTSDNISVTASGTYVVTATAYMGCHDTAIVTVSTNANPTITGQNDTTIGYGSSVRLAVTASGGTSPYALAWDPPYGLDTPTSYTPLARPLVSTNYIAVLTDANGCTSMDTILLDVQPYSDSSKIVNLMDTINGISDTLSFGQVKTFKTYFANVGKATYSDSIFISTDFNCATCIKIDSLRIYVGASKSPAVAIKNPSFPLAVDIKDSLSAIRVEQDVFLLADSCFSAGYGSGASKIGWFSSGLLVNTAVTPIKIIYESLGTASQSFTCVSPPFSGSASPRNTSCQGTSVGSDYDYFHLQSNWSDPSNAPIRYINVAFVFRQLSRQNRGNFDINNGSDLAYLGQVIDAMNSMLSNIEVPSDPRTAYCGSACHVVDSRIRIDVKAKIADSRDANLYNQSVPNLVSTYYPDQIMNIYFVGESGTSPGGIAHGNCVTMGNWYTYYLNHGDPILFAHNLVHEILHNFGLGHVYADADPLCPSVSHPVEDFSDVTNPNYLFDVFGTPPHVYEPYQWAGGCDNNANCDAWADHNDHCTNNIMGRGLYISPMQLGRVVGLMMMPDFPNPDHATQSRDFVCTGGGGSAYHFSSYDVIDFDVKFYQDIIVDAGATLKVTCTLRMCPGLKIIVSPGGKLIIDGGTITNSEGFDCEGVWQGVTVEGNSSQHQYAYSGNTYYQGLLSIVNGGMITNADVGAYVQAGGIIQVNTGSFLNNHRDVIFMPYANFQPGTRALRNNASYFNFATFNTDNHLITSGLSGIPYHTLLWSVNGVRFYGCTFEDSRLGQSWTGLYSISSNFIVAGCSSTLASPTSTCVSYQPNTFRNLSQGIWATKVSGNFNYIVDKNVFDQCAVGVKSEGVDGFTITRNSFNVGKSGQYFPSGILVNSGTNFRIEENSLTSASGIVGPIGIRIISAGADNNSVYKNELTNLGWGGYVSGQNRNVTGSNGLQLICNASTSNLYYDFYVEGGNSLYGIKATQGTTNIPAGNNFTTGGGNFLSGFNNSSSQSVTYYYGTGTSPIPYAPFNVTLIGALNPNGNTCQSNFVTPHFGPTGGGIHFTGRLLGGARIAAENAYDDNNTNYAASKKTYDSIIDGGNTDSLLSLLKTSDSTKMAALYPYVATISPYLSEICLRAIADRSDALTDEDMFAIFAGNPEVMRSPGLISYLGVRDPKFPYWMIDSLVTLSDSSTARSSLEASIGYYGSEKDFAAGLVTSDILTYTEDSDSVSDSIDYALFRSWMTRRNSALSDYQVVDNFISLAQTDSISSIFDSIPLKHNLDSLGAVEYSQMGEIFDILTDLSSDTDILHLSPAQDSIVSLIASSGEGVAKVRACNILHLVYNTPCEIDTVSLSDGEHRMGKWSSNGVGDHVQSSTDLFIVYPNPAKSEMHIFFSSAVHSSPDAVRITSIEGRTVLEQVSEGKILNKVMSAASLEAGSYICTIFEKGKPVASKRIVVIHE